MGNGLICISDQGLLKDIDLIFLNNWKWKVSTTNDIIFEMFLEM